MRGKKKRKAHKVLSDEEKKAFAQKLIDGKMFKQLVADYEISAPYGYQISRELLEWKLEWKFKEIENEN